MASVALKNYGESDSEDEKPQVQLQNQNASIDTNNLAFLKRPMSSSTEGSQSKRTSKARQRPSVQKGSGPSRATATAARARQPAGATGKPGSLPLDKASMMKQMRAYEKAQREQDKLNRARRHDQKQEQRREANERQLMTGEDISPYSEEGQRRLRQWENRLELEIEDNFSRQYEDFMRKKKLAEERRAKQKAMEKAIAERKAREELERVEKERQRDLRRKEAAERRKKQIAERKARQAEAERKAEEERIRQEEKERQRVEAENEVMADEEDYMRRFLAMEAEKIKWEEWEKEQEKNAEEEEQKRQEMAKQMEANKDKLSRLQELRKKQLNMEKAKLEEEEKLRKAQEESEKLNKQLRIEQRAKAIAAKERKAQRKAKKATKKKKLPPQPPKAETSSPSKADKGATMKLGKTIDLGGTQKNLAINLNETKRSGGSMSKTSLFAGNEDVECMTPRTMGKQQRDCMRKKRGLKIQRRKWLEEFRDREGRAPKSPEEKAPLEEIERKIKELEAREKALKTRDTILKKEAEEIKEGPKGGKEVDPQEEARAQTMKALGELGSKLNQEAEDMVRAAVGEAKPVNKLKEKQIKAEIRRCMKAKRNIKMKVKEWCSAYREAFGKEPVGDARAMIVPMAQGVSLIEGREAALEERTRELAAKKAKKRQIAEAKKEKEEAEMLGDAKVVKARTYKIVNEENEDDNVGPNLDAFSEDSWKLPNSDDGEQEDKDPEQEARTRDDSVFISTDDVVQEPWEVKPSNKKPAPETKKDSKPKVESQLSESKASTNEQQLDARKTSVPSLKDMSVSMVAENENVHKSSSRRKSTDRKSTGRKSTGRKSKAAERSQSPRMLGSQSTPVLPSNLGIHPQKSSSAESKQDEPQQPDLSLPKDADGGKPCSAEDVIHQQGPPASKDEDFDELPIKDQDSGKQEPPEDPLNVPPRGESTIEQHDPTIDKVPESQRKTSQEESHRSEIDKADHESQDRADVPEAGDAKMDKAPQQSQNQVSSTDISESKMEQNDREPKDKADLPERGKGKMDKAPQEAQKQISPTENVENRMDKSDEELEDKASLTQSEENKMDIVPQKSQKQISPTVSCESKMDRADQEPEDKASLLKSEENRRDKAPQEIEDKSILPGIGKSNVDQAGQKSQDAVCKGEKEDAAVPQDSKASAKEPSLSKQGDEAKDKDGADMPNDLRKGDRQDGKPQPFVEPIIAEQEAKSMKEGQHKVLGEAEHQDSDSDEESQSSSDSGVSSTSADPQKDFQEETKTDDEPKRKIESVENDQKAEETKEESGPAQVEAHTSDIMRLWLSRANEARDEMQQKFEQGSAMAATGKADHDDMGWSELEYMEGDVNRLIQEFEEEDGREKDSELDDGSDEEDEDDKQDDGFDPDIDLPGWRECMESTMPTSAHAAASLGHYEVLEYLCQMFDVFVTDESGRTPLFYAAVKNQMTCAALLVSHGAEWVNVGDVRGDTALHAAVLNDNVDLASFLLDCEANPGIANFAGLTAAHLARSPDAIKLLKDKGADVHCIDTSSKMPLWYACDRGNEETVAYLCEEMDQQWIGWPDDEGNTPLHIASERGHSGCVSLVCDAAWEWSALNAVNKKGYTPVHVAQDAETLRALYESGADLFFLNKMERMPLFFAAAKGLVDSLAFFLETAAWYHPHAIEYADKNGDTALHAAALKGSKDCVELLLGYVTEPQKKNNAGFSASELAANNGNADLAEFINTWEHTPATLGHSENEYKVQFDVNSDLKLIGVRWLRMLEEDSQAPYYYDQETGFTQWECPYDYDGYDGRPDEATHLLQAFYEQFNPEKVEYIPQIIEERSSDLDGIFTSLSDKYGYDFKQFMATYKATEKLTEFYTINNPDKLGDVQAIIEEHAADLDGLFRKLEEKYGKLNNSQELSFEQAREKLVGFYEKVNPAKIQDVDSILEHYAGDYSTLFHNLEAKYGKLEDLQYQERMTKEEAIELLTLFYSYYNPSKLEWVEAIIEEREYDLEGLFAELGDKYQVEIEKTQLEEALNAMEWARSTLTDFYSKYHPERLEHVEDILWEYQNDFDLLWQKLEAKYGIPIVSEKMDEAMARKRLNNLYLQYKPDNLWDVDNLLELHKDNYEALFEDLEKKYHGHQLKKGRPKKRITEAEARQRLVDFYTKHNPERLPMVEAILEQYANDYEGMFLKLESKYASKQTKATKMTVEQARTWLTEFYNIHNPERLDKVEDILKQYASNYEGLVLKLKQKYNVSDIPPIPSNDQQGVITREQARQRVTEFYTKNNPERLNTVEKILDHYAENYQALFDKLEAKYASSAAASSSAAKPKITEEEARTRLTDFYKKHNPERLKMIDAILEQYKGKYEAMFAKLEAKYRKEPEQSSPESKISREEARSKLTEFYTQHNPERLGLVESILNEYEGNFESLFEKLKAKYKTSRDVNVPPSTKKNPTATSLNNQQISYDEAKERLKMIYSKHCPEKLSVMDGILEHYKDNYGVLLKSLEKKYNEANSNSSTISVEDARTKLIAFYTKNNPEKLDKIDGILEQYKNNYDKLFKKLSAKYPKESVT